MIQSHNTLRYWLALWRAPTIGPQRFLKLLKRFPDLQELFTLKKSLHPHLNFSQSFSAYLQQPDWKGVENDLQWLQQPLHTILTIQDVNYPPLLKEIANPPPLLFVRGHVDCLITPQLAIVGSRHPTAHGKEIAYEFALQLAQLGLTITSGLAQGIDGASHQGALAANGKTIAVLGTGADEVYPPHHRPLAEKILAQNGALMSEYPIGTKPLAHHFPQRNRIISGLSCGVFVVEATLQSGSLITAQCALEQGREVFAMPGSLHNPLAKGCHLLLKQGAKLTETITDIIEELSPFLALKAPPALSPAKPPTSSTLDTVAQKLLEYIGFQTTDLDNLVATSGLPVNIVIAKLQTLELAGYIMAAPGGYIKR